MSAKPSILILASLGLAALGCQPSLDSVTVTPMTTPPLAATISGTNIQITEGTALAVEFVVTNSDGDEVSDASIMSMSDALGLDGIAGGQHRYLIHGDAVGTGQLECTSSTNDGTLTVPFTVTAQP
jgi:hypothetical protein